MGRVFIIQEAPGRNTTALAKYGEPVVLLPYTAQILFSSGPVARQLREKLKGFCDQDYLVAMGDPAAIGLACVIASQVNNGRFKLLKWDRQERLYYLVTFDLGPGSAVQEGR